MHRLRRIWPNLLTIVALFAVVTVSAAKLLSSRGRLLASPTRRDSLPKLPTTQKPKWVRAGLVQVHPAHYTTKVTERLRHHWPDLLIGTALICVLAMIAVTLLSGEPLLARDGPPEIPVTSTIGSNEKASEASRTAAPAATATGTVAAQAQDGAPDGHDVLAPSVPAQPVAGAASSAKTGSSRQATALRAGVQRSVSVAETTERQRPVDPAASSFLVAAGALTSRDAASTVAQHYRDGGYEVAVEQQGNLYLLWIGPYVSQAAADSAAERIIADGGDALVYTYSSDTDAANLEDADIGDAAKPLDAVAEGAVTQPLAPDSEDHNANGIDTATTTMNAGTKTIDASAGNAGARQGGQRYLQVGAFAFDENARPLRAQLTGLGLSVIRDEDAGGLVRLYVGPFGDAQLVQTRARLSEQGIDSFPVVP